MEAFENGTEIRVVPKGLFGRGDDEQKHIKKYAFSNKNKLIWKGENKTKTSQYFASFALRRKHILLKMHYCGRA